MGCRGLLVFVSLALAVAAACGRHGAGDFRVAAGEGPGPVVVAVAGDIACDPEDTYYYNGGEGRRNACRQRHTADLVEAIGPDVVLALGDLQYRDGSPEKYRQVYDPTWGRFKAITRPAIGGHDYYAPDGYFGYFGSAAGDPAKGYYSFDMGAWHFVALNSTCERVGGCWYDSPQGTWLEADLQQAAGKNILAYWHDPLFSSGQHGGDLYYRAFWDILRRHGAKLILNAHDHVYERFAPQNSSGSADPGGIRQFTAGLGGYLLYPFGTVKPNSEARYADTFGILKLALHPDAYEWQFIPEPGSTYSDGGRVEIGTGQSAGMTLYVSTLGDDAADGLTPGTALRTISKAAGLAGPGTTVLIAPGTYAERVITRAGGAAGRPIVFKAQGGTVSIAGATLPSTGAASQNQGLVELRHPFVRLEGLKVVDSKHTGILLAADDLAIVSCEVAQSQRHGIASDPGRIPLGGATLLRNLLVRGNTVHHTGLATATSQGISLGADGFTLADNVVYASGGGAGLNIRWGARHGDVSGNVVRDNVNQTGIYVDGASFVRIYDNTLSGNLHGIGVTSEDGRFTTDSVWVYQNIVWNQPQGNALYVWEPATTGAGGVARTLFFNNSWYGTRLGVYLSGRSLATDCRIFNNAGYATGGSIYRSASDASAYSQDHNIETAAGFADPGSGDLRLVAGSGAIDAGADLPDMVDDLGNTYRVDRDHAGAERVTGTRTDAGAFEYAP